ncbi:MAG: hypothetical protein QXK94_02480 [Candidatus Jordarchaeales archaeon]
MAATFTKGKRGKKEIKASWLHVYEYILTYGGVPVLAPDVKKVHRFGVEDDLDASFLHEKFDELEEITVLELEELADVLHLLLDLEPYTCPVRGVDTPCILCEEKCSAANYQEIETKLGKGRKTINSSTFFLAFEKHDEVEKFLIRKLARELSKKKLNVIDPEEGYDIGFLFTHEDRWRMEEIVSFVVKLFEKVRVLLPEAKSLLNSWVRKKVEEMEREEMLKKGKH